MSDGVQFSKVLIANRGEIAVRIAGTLRRLGIRSVVAYHPEEADSPAVRAADEAYPLQGDPPAAAYLDGAQIVDLCQRAGADAIHPGYGFLSENADFAQAVTSAGLCFIGPPPSVMRLMGDKLQSREFVRAHGFQVSPSVSEDGDPVSFPGRASTLGFPLLVKASAGGGGKGMQVVHSEADLAGAAALARSVAARSFGDDRIYAERYIERPRHIEVQVLADAHGHCIHLFERECSVQRRFQKIIEESPAPALDSQLRAQICAEAVGIARAAGYVNAGTVEFILAPDGTFYFLEMNTRIQVEHPVTEMVTGMDLVAEQLRIAAGQPLIHEQADIIARGWAIECRIYAEDADHGFLPATGKVLVADTPSGDGLRFDSGLHSGQNVTSSFDPLLAKLIAHGTSREEAVVRACEALKRTVILGVTTNTAFLRRVLAHPAFAAGDISTAMLEEHEQALRVEAPDADLRTALLAAAALADRDFVSRVRAVPEPHALIGHWRN